MFLLIGQGYAPRHIAETLCLSVSTIEGLPRADEGEAGRRELADAAPVRRPVVQGPDGVGRAVRGPAAPRARTTARPRTGPTRSATPTSRPSRWPGRIEVAAGHRGHGRAAGRSRVGGSADPGAGADKGRVSQSDAVPPRVIPATAKRRRSQGGDPCGGARGLEVGSDAGTPHRALPSGEGTPRATTGAARTPHSVNASPYQRAGGGGASADAIPAPRCAPPPSRSLRPPFTAFGRRRVRSRPRRSRPRGRTS